MSSVSGYTPGGFIAKYTQSVAEENAKRKKQDQALTAAEDALADEAKKAADEAANNTAVETDKKYDENGNEIIAQAGGDEEAKELTDEEKAAQAAAKLDDFKKGFQKNVRALTLTRHFILTKISLDIDDAGYEKMMNDPAYEQKVMGMIREKMGSPLNAAPGSVKVTVNARGASAEAEAGNAPADSLMGLSSSVGQTPSAIRTGTRLDALSDQVSAVLYYRLGADPMQTATSLLNRQA